MFWGLTFICEEYCVPAITIYCIRNNVSDNVAGSILIGAGLSLPVLFSSYVGLFASSSSIGLGTVLGGNIFNQTVNIAASVFVAPNRRLKLCKVTLSKEVLMYGISNLLIIWALEHDLYRSLAKVSDIKNWFRCLSVPWEYSMALVLFYFVYCLIAVYGERVFNFRFQIYNICGRMTRSPKPTLPSIQETCHELPNNLSEESSSDDVQFTRPFNCMPGKIQLSPSKCSDVQMDPTSVEFDLAAIDDQRSEDVAETGNAVTSIATDFILLKKTNSCKLLCSDKWKVRYCSFHDEGFISYRNKKSLPIKGRHARYVDLSNSNGSLVQDPIKFEFSINAIYPEKRTFHFQALDKIMFLAVTERINECLHAKKGIYRCELGRLSRIEM